MKKLKINPSLFLFGNCCRFDMEQENSQIKSFPNLISGEESKQAENELSLINITLNDDSKSTDLDLSENDSICKSPRDELIEHLMNLYSRHKLTKIAVEDIAKLMNSVPGASVQIPATIYLLFNEFLSKSKLKVYKYIFCKACEDYTKHDFTKKRELFCELCQVDLKKSDESFIYLQVAPQLERIVSDYFQEIISYREKCSNSTEEMIFDVCNGQLLDSLLRNEHFCSLTFNTDGVSIHGSSKYSLWPLMLVCNFLPPQHRFKERNIIVAGLYYGSTKPYFLKYLEPMAEEFEHLSNEGITVNSECFKFIVTHASLDLSAKSAVQCITQYNGYNSCSYCVHEGEKTTAGVRYTQKTTCDQLRNHSKMMLEIQQALATGNVINGIKGLSAMAGFKHFNLVWSFTIDYMHGVLLGVTKNQLAFWFDTKNHGKQFYITPKQKQIINRRIASIKPCRFISRRIESLDQYKRFKANQYRQFLLYFYPVLDGFLNKKYYNHFRLLSYSVYILLQPKITKNQLMTAKNDLQKYVTDYQSIYGKTQMTMNVHCLTHLVDCVEHMGPLWSYSMFTFESFNGTLKSYGEDSNYVMNQIVEKIAIKSSRSSKCETKKIDHLAHELERLQLQPQESITLRKYGLNDSCKYYAIYNRSSTVFTSKYYTKPRKTVDYFVSTADGIFGKVKYYLEQNNTSYALIEEFTVEKELDQFIEVISTTQLSIRAVAHILDKHIFMTFGMKNIIVKRPNMFEPN